MIYSLAFVFGGIPKDRIDPCASFGICGGDKILQFLELLKMPKFVAIGMITYVGGLGI